MPTMPDIAPLVSADEAFLEDYRNQATRMLCIAGLAGFPQLSLPLGTRLGAPLGISLLGPAGSDRSLVRAFAASLEPAMRKVAADAGIAFEPICATPEFLARGDDPAVLLAARLAGAEATTLVAFGTEAGLFQRAGIPTVVCGPGHIAQAHQADEYVSLAQLAAGERFLQGLMAVRSL